MGSATPVAIDDLSPEGREVAARFARLRKPESPAFFHALAEHFRHLRDHPVLPLHFEFAVTSNERGRVVAERIARLVDLGARRGVFRRRPRVLDVGCAYGGFLVAFAGKGTRVTGIEIDRRLLVLAEINLREQGVDARLVEADATREHPAFRGRFDVVTANDVVEHVPRLEPFLRNLRDWLTEDGVVYLEIPNGACPAYVRKDGHHELFGITLLDFEEASRYVKLLNPQGRYDTYHYLDLAAYRRLFESCGLSLTVLPETFAGASEEGIAVQVAALAAGLAAGLETVPAELEPLVRGRVEEYIARVEAAPRQTEGERRQYLLDYGPSFWIVLAKRLP